MTKKAYYFTTDRYDLAHKKKAKRHETLEAARREIRGRNDEEDCLIVKMVVENGAKKFEVMPLRAPRKTRLPRTR